MLDTTLCNSYLSVNLQTIINNMQSIQAVSYTHLDVYKRQVTSVIFHAFINQGSGPQGGVNLWRLKPPR